MDELLTGQELKAYEALMEKIQAEDPVSSVDMVRAWIRLNVEASTIEVQNN